MPSLRFNPGRNYRTHKAKDEPRSTACHNDWHEAIRNVCDQTVCEETNPNRISHYWRFVSCKTCLKERPREPSDGTP
jgi:hypothetical protein